jgi:hypothetical protein
VRERERERERESGRLSLFLDRVVVVTSRCESRGLCRGLVSCKGSGCGVVARLCELLKDSSDRVRLEGGLH